MSKIWALQQKIRSTDKDLAGSGGKYRRTPQEISVLAFLKAALYVSNKRFNSSFSFKINKSSNYLSQVLY